MSNKQITISESMTKDQEISLIHDFYQALPGDSYLKEILKQLPAYMEEQIQNDWMIDPIETIVDLKTENGKLTRRAEYAEQLAKTIGEERDKLLKRREDLHDDISDLQEDITEHISRIQELEKREAQNVETIRNLKARLYDFMAAGENAAGV